MTLTPLQTRLLRRTLELAGAARESGNPPFGSLLANESGGILAEESNTTVTDVDITAHPELKLARWAARHLPSSRSGALIMYTSCEPCPMCANAIGRAGIAQVVYAISTAQLDALKAPEVPPTTRPYSSCGPYLFPESTAPIADYYARTANPGAEP